MCTFLASETFSTKVWIFLAGEAHSRGILQHKSQKQGANRETNKDHSRRQRRHGSQGLTCPVYAPHGQPSVPLPGKPLAGWPGAWQMGQAESIYNTLLYLVLIC